jgi:hypothetical protein
MNHNKITAVLFIAIIISIVDISIVSADSKWEFNRQRGPVKLYSRSLPGKNYLEWLAVSTSNLSFESFIHVMKDIDGYDKWFSMTKEMRLLTKRTPTDFDLYCVLKIPVITDRDSVVNINQTIDYQAGRMTAVVRAIESPYGRNSGYVRLREMYAYFNVIKKTGGGCELSYRLYSDIGGTISPTAVNAYTYRQPLETLEGILLQASIYEKNKKG